MCSVVLEKLCQVLIIEILHYREGQFVNHACLPGSNKQHYQTELWEVLDSGFLELDSFYGLKVRIYQLLLLRGKNVFFLRTPTLWKFNTKYLQSPFNLNFRVTSNLIFPLYIVPTLLVKVFKNIFFKKRYILNKLCCILAVTKKRSAELFRHTGV